MIFNVTSYVKFINMQCEAYMADVLKELTLNNPEWIDNLKKDKDLFNEDGTPVIEVKRELIEQKIQSTLQNADFKGYKAKWETIVSLFKITEEDLKKFIIE